MVHLSRLLRRSGRESRPLPPLSAALLAVLLAAGAPATQAGAGAGAAAAAADSRAGAVSRGPEARRGPAGAPGAPADSLVLLHTNDVHSHLDPLRGAAGSELVGGAAARAALLARERALGGATLTLDAGDVFQGTAYFNYFHGIPEYRAMSRMSYDAGAIGNHELDGGPVGWLRVRREATFPLLSANVFVAAESTWAAGLAPVPDSLRGRPHWVGGTPVPPEVQLRELCQPFLIREIGGRRIALLGLMTGELPYIVAPGPNRGTAVSDPIAAAKAIVPGLRARADVVIAISHLGLDDDRRLAAHVPGIDVIVGGHSHTLLRAPVIVLNRANANGYHGTAIVQAGSDGAWVGRTTLHFDGARLASVTGRVLPVRPDEGEDSSVEQLLQPYRDSMATALSVPVAHTAQAYTRKGLEDGDTALGDFVADAMRDAAGADIAIQNAGGIRAGLPAGEVTVGDLYSVLPFENRIVVVRMKGWQVRGLLDAIARRIGKGSFAQVSGVRFVVRGDHASDIRVAGTVLESDRTYRVATIGFLYAGGDGYTQFAKAGPAENTGLMQREATIDFLRRHPDYRFRDDGRIHWEGSPGALRDFRMR
jgi:5'-nucleotidase/UDP-sugar diphosphatase